MNITDGLKKYQKRLIKQLIEKFTKVNSLDLQELFLKEKMSCRKCGGTWFVRNGRYNTNQRYKCKHCNSTQFIDANTSTYNLKYKDKWIDFIVAMLEKEKIPSCATIGDELEINIKTAHRWRHKLMAALMEIESLNIEAEVEIDEIYLPFCVKGRIGKEKFDKYISHKSNNNIESELRRKEIVMEEERYQTIYLCSHNRQGDFDFKPIKIQKKGIVSEEDLKRVISEMEVQGKTVITDSEPSMKAYFKNKEKIIHLTFRSSDMKMGIMKTPNVHNNNINNVTKRLKEWLKNFHGISTKYEINYLKWFRFRNLFKINDFKKTAIKTIKDKMAYERNKNIFNYYMDFVYL